MTRVLALTGRELRGYFLSPAGYIILALFGLMSGLVFVSWAFNQGQPATMRPVFEWGTWMFLFVCPAISMRAISEERRLGTYEMIMTCPVSETELVLGKYLGALTFLIVALIPLGVQVAALELYGRPDYGEVACGFLGLVMAGMAYLASGLFFSTMTTSQVVAFLLAMFFWIALSVSAKLGPQYLSGPWVELLLASDPEPRLHDFAIGLIDSSNIVYFVGVTIAFLAASVRTLQAGRWR